MARTWEYHRDAGRATGTLTRDSVGGAAELAQRRGSEFDESFVDYRERGYQALIVGRERIGDIEVDRVRIVRSDNWSVDYYFDTHSHLLVAKRKEMPVHAKGPDVETLTVYSDWQFVSGLLVPFTGQERRLATGEVMNTLKWDTIEFNIPIRRSDILPPHDQML